MTIDEARYLFEHPVYAWFHISIDLWPAIKANAADMWRRTDNPARDALNNALCLLVALKHIAMLLVYPITKTVYIYRILRQLGRTLNPQ